MKRNCAEVATAVRKEVGEQIEVFLLNAKPRLGRKKKSSEK